MFILNMFVKVALLHSALTVAVVANSEDCDNSDSDCGERESPSLRSFNTPPDSSQKGSRKPSGFVPEVGNQNIDLPTSPGLVSYPP